MKNKKELEMIAVKDTSKCIYFPPSIPRSRGHYGTLAKTLGVFLLLAISFLATEKEVTATCGMLCMYLLFTICFEILKRFCHVLEEVQHFKARYSSNTWKLLYDVFYFSWFTWSMLFMSCTVLIMCKDLSFCTMSHFCIFVAVRFLADFMNVEKCPLHTSLQINNMQGLDCGSCLAHSFFHGYLNIVLPNKGNDSKGIKALMKDYESKQDIKFGVHKLFILMPMSLHCPNTLEDFNNIEKSQSLDCIIKDRAGVVDRVYKNSVYKLRRSNGTKLYVSTEFATPLRTLRDIIKKNNPHANVYEYYRKELLLNFYLTLKGLLDADEECKNLCELIYYNDYDEHGKLVDISELLQKKIRRIQKSLPPLHDI